MAGLPTYPTTERVAEELGLSSSRACARFLQEELGLKPFPFGAGRGRGYRWKWAEVVEAMDAYRNAMYAQAAKPKKDKPKDDGYFRRPYRQVREQLTSQAKVQ